MIIKFEQILCFALRHRSNLIDNNHRILGVYLVYTYLCELDIHLKFLTSGEVHYVVSERLRADDGDVKRRPGEHVIQGAVPETREGETRDGGRDLTKRAVPRPAQGHVDVSARQKKGKMK